MRRIGSDDGAISTILVVVLSFGMLLGLGATVLDYGAVYAERRQLQNGADAAVLALARDCAADESGCDASEAAAAPWLAGNNSAADGVGSVFDVCRAAAGVTGPCGNFPGGGALTDCLVPNTSTQAGWSGFIEVRTQTQDIPAIMGQVFGPETKDAGACARAAWGRVASLNVAFPVTFSKCEWQWFTSGAGFAPAPPYGGGNPRPSSRELSIVLKDPAAENAPSTCPASPPGGDHPGGFGWIDVDSNCTSALDAGGNAGADPGNSPPNIPGRPGLCDDLIRNSLETVIYIPIYDSTTGTGENAIYHIAGFAGLYLTGYKLAGGLDNAGDLPSHTTSRCFTGASPSTRCLYGWFVEGVVPGGGTIGGGGTDYGARIVQLTG